MRELARIQFIGDDAAFANVWNKMSPDHPIQYGLIVLYKDSVEYSRLRELFEQYPYEGKFEWRERVEVEYSKRDLKSHDVLQLQIVGDAGEGGNEYSPAYEERVICPSCDFREFVQVEELTLDIRELSGLPDTKTRLQTDLFRTRFGEFIVSKRLKELLESTSIPHISLRRIHDFSSQGAITDAVYQLLVHIEIGPFVVPSPVERSDYCSDCDLYGRTLLSAIPKSRGSEFYMPRQSFSGAPLMQSLEKFGVRPHQRAILFISQDFYKLLSKERIKGFWVQPAHLME